MPSEHIEEPGVFAGYNLVFGMIVPHISNSAHMGGFITGLILGAVLARSLTIPHRNVKFGHLLQLRDTALCLGDFSLSVVFLFGLQDKSTSLPSWLILIFHQIENTTGYLVRSLV
jgi:hypothetical protein